MIVQRSRYVLKSRVTRARRCPEPLFQPACIHLVDWLEHHAFFGPILTRLKAVAEPQVAALSAVAKQVRGGGQHYIQPGRIDSSTLEKHAAGCLAVVYTLAREPFPTPQVARLFLNCLSEYVTGDDKGTLTDWLDTIRDVALDGLYEYLDEQVDSRNALMSVLLKYQHRSEWFRRKRLREVAANGLENEATGERALAIDLQEYVFNQGIEFVIEPVSATGEVDLVLRDSNDRHLILDAKYIQPEAPPSEVKRKLSHGFNQVAKYCGDYQEPAGYMIAFNNHAAQIVLPLEEVDGLRLFKVGNVAVYFVEVAISDTPPASKAGKASQIIVSAEELVAEFSESQAQ